MQYHKVDVSLISMDDIRRKLAVLQEALMAPPPEVHAAASAAIAEPTKKKRTHLPYEHARRKKYASCT